MLVVIESEEAHDMNCENKTAANESNSLKWSNKGNAFFNMSKFNKSIDAYGRATELNQSSMVQNGCDLLTIQQVMRHNDIQTTMRYLNLDDDAKRSKYDIFLKL